MTQYASDRTDIPIFEVGLWSEIALGESALWKGKL
jgi:hypothetical protein